MKAPVAVCKQLHEMKEKLNHWTAQRRRNRGVGGGGAKGGRGGIFSLLFLLAPFMASTTTSEARWWARRSASESELAAIPSPISVSTRLQETTKISH